MVTAVAMDNKKSSLTWVSADLTGITDVLCKDVRKKTRKSAPAINAKNIFISATHTHNAPYIKSQHLTNTSRRCMADDDILSVDEYHDFVVEKITDAVIEANKKKNPDVLSKQVLRQ